MSAPNATRQLSSLADVLLNQSIACQQMDRVLRSQIFRRHADQLQAKIKMLESTIERSASSANPTSLEIDVRA